MFGAQANASTSSSCALTSSPGSDNPSSPVSNFSSGTKTHSVNLDASFANTGDASDTVEMIGHYASTLTVAKSGGSLTKAVMSGSGSVSVHRALGNATACAPQALVDGFSIASFTESKPGWMLVDRQTVAKQGLALAAVVHNGTGDTVAFDLWQGRASHATERGFVTPGSYQFELAVGLTAGVVPPLLKSPPKTTVSMAFHPAGSAPFGTAGSGKRFVSFPSSVSCGTHKATLRWTSNAGKVASGAFLVNGVKKASDATPHPGEAIVLKHLSSTADNTITAKLKLKSGGSASASRTYLPCKG
jgi:hypothetical protein